MASFCSNCGAPQEEGIRFCGQCGQPLASPSAPPAMAPAAAPPPAANDGEHVLGVVPNLAAGTFGAKSYVLVLTDSRLLVVRITSQIMAEAVRKSQEEGKAQGKGFFQRWGDQIAAGFRYSERYLSMAPEQILRENAENYAIDRSQVTRISFVRQERDDGPDPKGTMRLEAAGRSLVFQMASGGMAEARSMLRQALGPVVR
jgi:hypothetical protein